MHAGTHPDSRISGMVGQGTRAYPMCIANAVACSSMSHLFASQVFLTGTMVPYSVQQELPGLP